MELQILDEKLRSGRKIIADILGCDPTMVTKVLSGKRNHKTRMGRKIVQMAKVTIASQDKLTIQLNKIKNQDNDDNN